MIGDKVYSKGRNIKKNTKDKIVNLIDNFNRQALHAKKISFFHPMDRRLLTFDAKKPKDFLSLEKVLFED